MYGDRKNPLLYIDTVNLHNMIYSDWLGGKHREWHLLSSFTAYLEYPTDPSMYANYSCSYIFKDFYDVLGV